MLKVPPANFSLETFYPGVYFFQDWEIFPGISTGGPKNVTATLAALNFPATLEGLRVLEIGPWNGFFTFECIRRGAAEVVALGPDDPDQTGFNKTMQLLEVSDVKYIKDTIYKIPRLDIGTFDIVLFLGVIYHLRHPLLAIDILHDVCRKQMYIDTPIIDFGRHLKSVNIDVPNEFRTIPLLFFAQRDEMKRGDDVTNWFKPNLPAFRDLIESSGLVITHSSHSEHWAYAQTEKIDRGFALGYEGHDPTRAHVAL